jgi:hypothetical protein
VAGVESYTEPAYSFRLHNMRLSDRAFFHTTRGLDLICLLLPLPSPNRYLDFFLSDIYSLGVDLTLVDMSRYSWSRRTTIGIPPMLARMLSELSVASFREINVRRYRDGQFGTPAQFQVPKSTSKSLGICWFYSTSLGAGVPAITDRT